MLEQTQWLILTVCRSRWVFLRTCVSCHLEEQKWKSSECNWAQTQSLSSPIILPSPAPLHSPSAIPTGSPGGVKKILALLWPTYQYSNVFLQWQTQGIGNSPSPLGCHTLAQEFLKPTLLASSGMFTDFSLVFLHCGAHITHQDPQHSPFFLPYQQDITDFYGSGRLSLGDTDSSNVWDYKAGRKDNLQHCLFSVNVSSVYRICFAEPEKEHVCPAAVSPLCNWGCINLLWQTYCLLHGRILLLNIYMLSRICDHVCFPWALSLESLVTVSWLHLVHSQPTSSRKWI